jgi:hypothetical protein
MVNKGAAVNIPDSASIILWGMLGGALIEITHWYGLRTNRNFPAYVRSVGYWVLAAIMVVLGGIIALLFLGTTGAPKDAIALGLATPAVLQKLAAAGLTLAGAGDDTVRGKGDELPETRDRGSVAGPNLKDFLVG